MKKLRGRRNTIEKFWSLVDRKSNNESGCWVWTRPGIGRGYGLFKLDGRYRIVHRLAYEHTVGPIPNDLVLDHLCRNKLCVNPAHLEPVTRGENVLRGEGITARFKARTHCSRGHALTSRRPNGHRICVVCRACEQQGLPRSCEGVEVKLFDNMTPTEKIDHMEAMLAKALPEVKEVTCLADILDIWDYWMPYLIPRARRLEAVAEAAKRLSDNIAEFDVPTDSCFLERVDDALAALESE